MPLTSYTGPEALAWLKSNGSKVGFAGNRFGSTREAIAFVEELYGAGAARVLVPDDAIRKHHAEVSEHGGPYADSLVIELPSGDRADLFEIYEHEAEAEGYGDMKGADSVIDGRYLFLWWD
jgi:hypothetical protein